MMVAVVREFLLFFTPIIFIVLYLHAGRKNKRLKEQEAS